MKEDTYEWIYRLLRLFFIVEFDRNTVDTMSLINIVSRLGLITLSAEHMALDHHQSANEKRTK